METNDSLRRRMNDDRRRRFGSSGRLLALLCECGDEACSETVVLTPEDYDARRPEPVVHPLHGAENSRLAAAAEAAGQGFEPQLTDPESLSGSDPPRASEPN